MIQCADVWMQRHFYEQQQNVMVHWHLIIAMYQYYKACYQSEPRLHSSLHAAYINPIYTIRDRKIDRYGNPVSWRVPPPPPKLLYHANSSFKVLQAQPFSNSHYRDAFD